MIVSRGMGFAGPSPSTVGDGPVLEANFDHYLRAIGIEPQEISEETDVLVVGETGWEPGTLETLLLWREGQELRVYSQELYASLLVNGRDPLEAPPDWIEAFRDKHPALQYLSQLGFKWPTVRVSRSESGNTLTLDVPEQGFLSFLGYRVGISRGLPDGERRRILSTAFQSAVLPTAKFDVTYIAAWGLPGSAARLQKIANSIAAFASSHDPHGSFSTAVHHWESDLAWLRQHFYYGRFTFRWPSTRV